AHQSACAHFVLAAVGSHRQGVEQPHFQRQLLEQAAAQHIMRMIVRIDEPGHDQPSGCIDDFVRAVGKKIGADRMYLVVFDQDVGDRRLMDVALVVVNLAASDQRSLRRHLPSALRSSAPYQRRRCRFDLSHYHIELLYCLAVLGLHTTSECCYLPENSLTIPCGVLVDSDQWPNTESEPRPRARRTIDFCVAGDSMSAISACPALATSLLCPALLPMHDLSESTPPSNSGMSFSPPNI